MGHEERGCCHPTIGIFEMGTWEVFESDMPGVEAHTAPETLAWFSPPVVVVARGVAAGKSPATRSHSQSTSGVFNTTNQIWQDSRLLSKGNSTLLAPPLGVRVRIFWSGTVPALWRCVPGIALYFSTLNLLEGCSARSVVGTTLLPFTVVKTRAEAGLSEGLSMFACLRKIYVQNGLSGLFRGLVPTLVRDIPYSGIYLVFYSELKALVVSRVDEQGIRTYQSCACALVASTLATAVTQPADVLRTNRQLHNQASPVAWYQVFRDTVRADGATGLWRGLSLRLLRRIAFSCITWTLFDHIHPIAVSHCGTTTANLSMPPAALSASATAPS
ncbi:unnamed protein product [Schistocephalus solidus]|uniref:Solute carrier family 25 member 38 n=2 Tax=Schistocephalus solidus TaxID=70667 RepID=A0A183SKQ6_SCHSO|nr:unnamed protein product [Schistocephalus solidus]